MACKSFWHLDIYILAAQTRPRPYVRDDFSGLIFSWGLVRNSEFCYRFIGCRSPICKKRLVSCFNFQIPYCRRFTGQLHSCYTTPFPQAEQQRCYTLCCCCCCCFFYCCVCCCLCDRLACPLCSKLEAKQADLLSEVS